MCSTVAKTETMACYSRNCSSRFVLRGPGDEARSSYYLATSPRGLPTAADCLEFDTRKSLR
jgi:hypothetical protein